MYTLTIMFFVLGYLCIAFEHSLKIDKAASALLTAIACWTLLALSPQINTPSAVHDTTLLLQELRHHLAEIAEILFFLLGAMTIVELIDAHDGFKLITDRIHTTKKSSLLWVVGLITFFLSAVLDNLTTTIVMVSMLRRLIASQQERWVFAGLVVIAANAGGAWSPIGDVTTTMLWIGNQITATGVISRLFLPSLVALLVPLTLMSLTLRGDVTKPEIPLHDANSQDPSSAMERNTVFFLGIGLLLFVPVFKAITHLPPYLGILLGLSILWVTTEIMHRSKN
ncbi:MAG TPA: sodium:proton antiporter NhaD, partial [Pseudomonadales bacterium]|nr:sodium:proton antiporter NhaD [Pseudomonadales bacterium]